jgi:hypothetical protein
MKVKFKLSIEREGEKEFSLEDNVHIPEGLREEDLGFDMHSFGEVMFNLFVLATCKSIQYGPSWKKRGELRGVAANLDRKWDRISKSFDDIEKRGLNDPAPRLDGTGDLAVYCLLYLSSFLRQQYPEAFERWWTEEIQTFIDRYRPLRSIERPGGEPLSAPKVA